MYRNGIAGSWECVCPALACAVLADSWVSWGILELDIQGGEAKLGLGAQELHCGKDIYKGQRESGQEKAGTASDLNTGLTLRKDKGRKENGIGRISGPVQVSDGVGQADG